MDIEAEVRRELISHLNEDFECLEEVNLQTFGVSVRCDVLAIPRHDDFAQYTLAFECKRPSQSWNYATWAKAIHQASHYVDATVADGRTEGVVFAAFLYPAPMITPCSRPALEHPLIRPGHEHAVAGMFHLALYRRVGRAVGDYGDFSLIVGPNEIWSRKRGFPKNAQNLLTQRRVGSRMKTTAARDT